MEPAPRSAFEVVEAELFLDLLMRLFADPTCLNGRGEGFEIRAGGKVREVVLPFAGCTLFADEPAFAAHAQAIGLQYDRRTEIEAFNLGRVERISIGVFQSKD